MQNGDTFAVLFQGIIQRVFRLPMPSQDPSHAESLQDQYEIRPDPVALTHNEQDPSQNAESGVDYEPYPEKSIPISPAHEKIVKAITSLYSGSASKEDMEVYAHDAIYDDPWSYCDTRYKIAGQWYGRFGHPSPALPISYPRSTYTISPDGYLANVHGLMTRRRHSQDHGVLQDPRDRDRGRLAHGDHLQAEAGVQAAPAVCQQGGEQFGDADAGWRGQGPVPQGYVEREGLQPFGTREGDEGVERGPFDEDYAAAGGFVSGHEGRCEVGWRWMDRLGGRKK